MYKKNQNNKDGKNEKNIGFIVLDPYGYLNKHTGTKAYNAYIHMEYSKTYTHTGKTFIVFQLHFNRLRMKILFSAFVLSTKGALGYNGN